MKELIPIITATIDGQEVMSVDGRSLHAFLEVGKDFSTWMKDRIEKYGFVEGIDFVRFPNSGESSSHGGDRRSIDYAMTIGMGKEICMVENNERGRQARLYFIECERRALELAKPKADRPRLTDAELNARSHAVTLRCMARMAKVYPPATRALFLAEAAAVLSGNPIERYLPPVADGREHWLSPTQIGKLLGRRSHITIGRALKTLGLHGENDPGHEWSQPIWGKGLHSDKQIVSYLYNPDITLPPLMAYFETPPIDDEPVNHLAL